MTQLRYLFTDGCGGVLIFLRSEQTATFWGCWDPGVGPMTPKFELGRDFCRLHLTPKFRHPKFNRLQSYRVDKQTHKLTNKQTPLKTSTSLRYATPVSKRHNRRC